MDVIAAMLSLPASEYAPANVSGVGGSISVAPSYAAKLATVGATPDMLLGWLEQNLQPSQKAPWIPGSANAPAAAVQPPANNATPVTPHPAPKSGTATTAQPVPAYPATPKASQEPAQPNPAAANKVTPTEGASGTATTAAGTNAAGVSSTGAGAPASPNAPGKPGSVVPNPPVCPAGESLAVAPNGSRCMPDSALSVKPSVAAPWWKLHEQALAAALAALLAVLLGIVLWRRFRDPYRAYR